MCVCVRLRGSLSFQRVLFYIFSQLTLGQKEGNMYVTANPSEIRPTGPSVSYLQC
jgi:hypothetical protein